GLMSKCLRLYVFPEPSADEEAENDEDHADHGQLGEFGQYLFDDLTLKIADFHYAAQLFCLVSSIDGGDRQNSRLYVFVRLFSVICSEYVCPGIITERFMFTNHFCVRMRHDDAFLIFDNDKIYAVFKNILVGQRLDLFVITQIISVDQ